MKQEKNKNTEEKILNAAKHIFHDKGMEGARMQEIADKAGINKAMLHYYYRSKQLLFEAVFKNAFSLIAPQLNAVLNDSSTIEDKIKNFTSNYISFMLKHPYLPNFIFQELNRNENFILRLKETGALPNLDTFKKQVDQEVTDGLIKPIQGEQLFIHLLSLCVFPFIGKPLIKALADIDNKTYEKLIDERKKEVSDFIINAIKPN